MRFTVIYHEAVAKEDIPKLSSEWPQNIRLAIEGKLTVQPEVFGKPLRRSLKGYRKLRVGDYRVIFRIEVNTVIIFLIAHRSIVYKKTYKRIS
ncbi:MAG: type II toxin-antitoxin system RelE/ParE family toxin [Candidatus Portnoybacteria bacterium]|nr:type II toxin-antitoxin system RelE/ParE family toxin [Candidatus Portnoybacteria bacterium]